MRKFPWFHQHSNEAPKPVEAEIYVSLDRDSVCAGDDTEPHRSRIALPETATVSELLGTVIRQNYLAKISGGEAAWLIVAGQKGGTVIGVTAEQWDTVKLIIPANTLLKSLFADDNIAFYFLYRSQEDPSFLFDHLQSGRELPRRTGSA